MSESQKALSPVLVTDSDSLSRLVEELSGAPSFAVDTESNSLYAYRERVCLIQFSIPTGDFILDPFCFADLNFLRPLFANPAQQKVFHAAEYDISCLRRDYGFEFEGVFDTMIAARTLGWPAVGLDAILQERFGVKLNKKYQRADWSSRPLSLEMLEYAQLDTHYLLALRDLQLTELENSGRMEEAAEDFERIAQTPGREPVFDTHGFWRINEARELSPRQIAVLRELYFFRDRHAARADRPAFKILGDRTLVEIAQMAPKDAADLRRIHGMSTGQIRRFGAGLIKAVRRGLHSPIPRRPRTQPFPRMVHDRYKRLLEWRKAKARSRGVESDVIMNREILWSIANRNPVTLDELQAMGLLGPWRIRTYGAELIELLADT